ncbi:hypothetical protein SAMN04488102_10960 [Alkalibacterium subtropicum]|uniref:YqgU-like 6-bladed beta-propeller domain-containing protein n=1 Tax=Alkalibacterium subtropicum TaxID=753702 RepID=A0A1I1JZ14_9LACT|nr:hypothetical protein [Alkalibacterium subtropicum]SFC53172.1 hypothetical protein SAMN04488102_10960 [Alkalibacterium subtropicum]
MIKKGSHYIQVILILICCCLFLFSCTALDPDDTGENQPPEEEQTALAKLDIDYRSFQKIVGWLDDETLLVHLSEEGEHNLTTFNIFSGETNQIYSDDASILSVMINQSRDKIMLQEIKYDQSALKVLSVDGALIQSTTFGYASYVNFDWNPTNDNTVFISHYNYEHSLETETILVYIWTIDENTFSVRDIPSLSPRWYSENVYLYIDELHTPALYIGDIREDKEDMIINKDISDFFLYQDTFVGIVESDISDSEVLLFHEYPFLVGDKVIRLPKVTMNELPVKPQMTQSVRNGKIYGVIPDHSFSLEEELGDYHLAHLHFEDETVIEVMDLPEDAPIALSPSEEYLLYGWRLENIIDLSDPELIELIEILN